MVVVKNVAARSVSCTPNLPWRGGSGFGTKSS
jgi:hypothetical protein